MAKWIPWAFCVVWYLVMLAAMGDAVEAFKLTAGWLMIAAHVTYIFHKRRQRQEKDRTAAPFAANLNQEPRRPYFATWLGLR